MNNNILVGFCSKVWIKVFVCFVFQLTTFLKQNKINVSGTDVAEPFREFTELQEKYRVHQDIIENVHRLGYATPTPIQMQAIPVMLQVNK